MLGGLGVRFAQQERKGRERTDIPCRPAKRPTKNWHGRRHSPSRRRLEGSRASERASESLFFFLKSSERESEREKEERERGTSVGARKS